MFRRGSVYSITLGIQLSAGILVVPLLTRVLNPSEYGALTVALVVVQVLVVVAAAGIPAAVTRFHFGDGGSTEARALVPITFVVALVVATVATATGPWWSNLIEDLEYGTLLRVATWTIVPLAVTLSAQASLQAEDRAREFVFVGAISGVGAQLTGLAAVVLIDKSPSQYLLGFLVGTLAAAIVAISLVRPPVKTATFRLLKRALHYGGPTVPHSLALFLVAAGDRFVVEREMGLTEVARYQVAYLVGALGIGLAVAFNNAWAPLVYSSGDEARPRVLSETTRAAFLVSALAAGAIAMMSPIGLSIAAPSGYAPEDLVPITAIVAVGVIPYVGYLASAHVAFQHGKTSVFAWLTPLVAATNVILNLVLVPRFGLAGAAFTTLASYLLLATGLHLRIRRIESVPWVYRAVGTSTVLGTALVATGAYLPSSGAGIVVRSLITIGLLALVIRYVVRIRDTSSIRANG